MKTYIHPFLYYITVFIIFGLLVVSVINDILKKIKYLQILIFILIFYYFLNMFLMDYIIEMNLKSQNNI